MAYPLPNFKFLGPKKLRKVVAEISSEASEEVNPVLVGAQHIKAVDYSVLHTNHFIMPYVARLVNDPLLKDDKKELLHAMKVYFDEEGKNTNKVYKNLFESYLVTPEKFNLVSSYITRNSTARYLLKEYSTKINSSFIRQYVNTVGKYFLDQKFADHVSELMVNTIGNTDPRMYLVNECWLVPESFFFKKCLIKYCIRIALTPRFANDFNRFKGYTEDFNAHELRDLFTTLIKAIPSNHTISLYQPIIDWIKDELGFPYERRNFTKWEKIPKDIKDKFNTFVMQEELERFFGRQDPSGRLKFWKKYIRYIKIFHIETEADNAAVFYLNRHFFIEFLEGGATFCYEGSVDDYYNFIDGLAALSKTAKVGYLKSNTSFNPQKIKYSASNYRWRHDRGWEIEFENTMRNLDYK
ncbi:MAG: hypothetical protein OCC49_10450 [Fibrobacterales bacterium]